MADPIHWPCDELALNTMSLLHRLCQTKKKDENVLKVLTVMLNEKT